LKNNCPHGIIQNICSMPSLKKETIDEYKARKKGIIQEEDLNIILSMAFVNIVSLLYEVASAHKFPFIP
jgi:hypothetical protein